jgi:UDP-N-acetylglucosamine--N-acetylmuramyl-(pentapeptide) pyrophosphoryl-undecaprenol N-acetylglucosamine transferase
MKLLIAAGGTGGHIYPGIAVANEILARQPGSEIMFVGTARGLEKRIVPDNGFQLALIHSAGLKNVGFAGKMKGMLILPNSFREAWKILRDFRPDVVVGAGGYVSGPVLLTAHFMGFPTLVMDSNALPGFTNRQLARFVDKAALTFEASVPFFGDKGVVTGNPVRKEFFDIAAREASKPVKVLVFGGSQGSAAINKAVIDALQLLDAAEVEIIHQTGEAGFDEVRAAYDAAGRQTADVRPYITNMVEAFDAADLIISRAGATTFAEAAAAGKPVIMIPLPTAADNHQQKNAEAIVERGGGRMILQSALTGEVLAAEINELIKEPAKLSQMGAELRKMSRPDAAAAAADLIEKLDRK